MMMVLRVIGIVSRQVLVKTAMCIVVLVATFENAWQIDRGENGRQAITIVKVRTQLT